MNRLLFFLIPGCLILGACENADEMEADCQNAEIEVLILDTQDSPCGEMLGRIEATAQGGTGVLRYSVDGINFQLSGLFEELAPGKYQVLVRDEQECEGTASTTLFSGISFAQEVEGLIGGTCAVEACHVSGAQAPDLSLRSNIFTAAPRIKTQLNAGLMPPKDSSVEPLSEAETQKILCWVNDGAPDN